MRARRGVFFKNDLVRFILADPCGWLCRNLLCRIGWHRWQPGLGMGSDESTRQGFVGEFSRWCWFCDKVESKAGRRLSRICSEGIDVSPPVKIDVPDCGMQDPNSSLLHDEAVVSFGVDHLPCE